MTSEEVRLIRHQLAMRAAHLATQTESTLGITEGGRARPRPHIRRAHWHTYRTGSGRTETTIKWVAPIPINITDGDIIPTIHQVQP